MAQVHRSTEQIADWRAGVRGGVGWGEEPKGAGRVACKTKAKGKKENWSSSRILHTEARFYPRSIPSSESGGHKHNQSALKFYTRNIKSSVSLFSVIFMSNSKYTLNYYKEF